MFLQSTLEQEITLHILAIEDKFEYQRLEIRMNTQESRQIMFDFIVFMYNFFF